MKTSKILLFATIVALTSVICFAFPTTVQADHSKTVRYMSFEQAVQRPALIIEMYKQLNDDFLLYNKPNYTEHVSYQGITVQIIGRYLQWEMFFQGVATTTSLKR